MIPINARNKLVLDPAGVTPITPERLLDLGFMTDDEKAANEYVIRIVGADDKGQKEDSNDDKDDDEVCELTISPETDNPNNYAVYIETYSCKDLNITQSIELGIRTTMEEIILLCKALKAWAITYPGE